MSPRTITTVVKRRPSLIRCTIAVCTLGLSLPILGWRVGGRPARQITVVS